MPFEYAYSDKFKEQYKKLDKRQKSLVKKKIKKISENPNQGKPLHAPLQNYKSERVEKIRIVYKAANGKILFAWIGHRGKVYRKN